ncbi:MAG: acetoacetate decarboxylase family protein [Acidimicrobiales bacterium]
MDVPPPWGLGGECLVGMVRHRSASDLPCGLARVPGLSLVVGARYDRSPVGPYLELAVGEPARSGVRVGMCVTTMVVTTADARHAGRSKWGMPKVLGDLTWDNDGETRVLRWDERGLVLRATPVGPPLPILVPFRSLQRRGDGLVSATASLRGLARLARVDVEVAEIDPLAWLEGRHVGAVVGSARLAMGEASLLSGLRTPRWSQRPAPDPALLSGPSTGRLAQR